MSDTKPSFLDQRWGFVLSKSVWQIWTMDEESQFICTLKDREITAHIVQLHNAELDRNTLNRKGE